MVMTMIKSPMRTITASQFKTKCLALMDEVLRTGEAILITKNGKPVAHLTPPGNFKGPRKDVFGLHSGLVYPIGNVDLAQPVADPADWTADDANIGR